MTGASPAPCTSWARSIRRVLTPPTKPASEAITISAAAGPSSGTGATEGAASVANLRIARSTKAQQCLMPSAARCALVELARIGDRLDRLGPRRAAHAADTQPHLHHGLLALVEQLGLEIDLPARDRGQVGRDAGGQGPGLGLGDRQRGQRPAALRRGQRRGAFEQPRAEAEAVAPIALAPRRLAQQERERAVGDGVLCQVVEDREPMLPAVAEVFGDRAGGAGNDPFRARRGVGAARHEDAAVGCAMGARRLDRPVDARGLLLPCVLHDAVAVSLQRGVSSGFGASISRRQASAMSWRGWPGTAGSPRVEREAAGRPRDRAVRPTCRGSD